MEIAVEQGEECAVFVNHIVHVHIWMIDGCICVFAERDAQSDFFTYAKENKIDNTKPILVIIGPEGGFSQKEFDFFKEKNIPLITLGNLIYRADTALTAALTTVINGVFYA